MEGDQRKRVVYCFAQRTKGRGECAAPFMLTESLRFSAKEVVAAAEITAVGDNLVGVLDVASVGGRVAVVCH